jgi:hypothetical protein
MSAQSVAMAMLGAVVRRFIGRRAGTIPDRPATGRRSRLRYALFHELNSSMQMRDA